MNNHSYPCLIVKCPKCGCIDHEPRAKFCHVCGTFLANQVGSPTHGAETPKPDPQPYGAHPFETDNPLSKNVFSNHGNGTQRRENSWILYCVIIVLVFLFVGYGIYYGISNWGTSSIEYIDKQSQEAWKYRRIDPNKYDYILNGEPEPDPVTGKLIVNSSPQGADIILDGKNTGLTTPATIDGITEGEHKVSVKMNKIKITNTWFNIGNNEYSILFTFEEPYIPIVNHR